MSSAGKFLDAAIIADFAPEAAQRPDWRID